MSRARRDATRAAATRRLEQVPSIRLMAAGELLALGDDNDEVNTYRRKRKLSREAIADVALEASPLVKMRLLDPREPAAEALSLDPPFMAPEVSSLLRMQRYRIYFCVGEHEQWAVFVRFI